MKKRQPLLKHTQIIRLGRILNMMYTPAELAHEIGVTPDTVYRSYLVAGLPHTRDRKHIWIHGPAFVAWAKETVTKHRRIRRGLPDDQAWCMKCGIPVPMIDPKIKYANRYIEILQTRCPHCQTLVNRARARVSPSPKSALDLGEGRVGVE